MRTPYQATIQVVRTTGGHEGKMRETLRRIGSAIRNASIYPPIRNHAASLASQAPPKDFLGQLRSIYDDFTRRWRYVKDPAGAELVTSSPEAIWRLTMAGDGVGVGFGKGAGDCDCATVALGAQLEAVGFPVRIGTTTGVGTPPGRLFSHVFIQALPSPKIGWVTLDPVLHPLKPFGATAQHSRIAWWDLNGNLLGAAGNVVGLHGEKMQNITEWTDYGFGFVDEQPNSEPASWDTVNPTMFGWVQTPSGLVSGIGTYGWIDGSRLNGMLAEVDLEEYNGQAMARTPMLALSTSDFHHMNKFGPYSGMPALGDNGDLYYYDGLGGFFKKMFRKAKKLAGSIRKKIKKTMRKVLKRTKFGRVLLKVGDKIKAVAMKIVRPLMKFVGKWAGKLAPIAAMIPGWGTAISAGLMVAGKIAKVMNKFSATTKGKKGSVRGLSLKDPSKLPALKAALNAEAKIMSRQAKQNPRAFKALLARAQAAGR